MRKVKKSLISGLAVIALLSVSVLTVFAGGNIDLWQIGAPHGSVNPINGSAEYPANRHYYPSFNYSIGDDVDPINAPSIPGYIGPANVCDFAGNRPCTDTTAELNIQFDLACYYGDGELMLHYDRYGSEADKLYLDGYNFATVSATEGGWKQFTFDLGPIAPGPHVLTIEYAGGGSGNGHYIDYIEIHSTKECPIPVDIDIKPGSDPNCFNSDSHGVIPVAILGSSTFDASTIDPFSVGLDGAGVRVRGKSGNAGSLDDVNGDGYLDLVVQIIDEGTYQAGDTWATLSGMAGLNPITGGDSICIRP
jgi:hypothetical protein